MYFIGIFFAFLEPLIYSFSNLIDNYYANHSFKYVSSVVFYSRIFSLPFIPLVFLIDIPSMPQGNEWFYIIAAGVVGFLYAPFFYSSLKSMDTSMVAALFSIGRIFVPVLAFFAVEERLQFWQYGGIAIILVSTMLLSKKKAKWKISAAFFYMSIAAILLSVESVLYKKIFETADWSTGFVWGWLLSDAAAMLMFLFPKYLKQIKQDFAVAKKRMPVFLGQGVIDTIAEGSYLYAVSLIPVTVVKGISSTQPIFVLLFSVVLSRTRYKKLLDEDYSAQRIKHKIFYYILIVVGTVIIIIS